MVTPRQKQYLEQLIPILDHVANFDVNSLIQRERLGSELSFEFLRELFVEIHSSAERLYKLELEKIPSGVLAQLVSPFQQIREIFVQISKFSPVGHGNPIEARNSIGQALEDQWSSIYVHLQTILALPADDITRKEMDVLASQVQTSVQLSSEAAEALRTKQIEIERTLDDFLSKKSAEFQKEGVEKLQLVSAALDEVRKAAAEAGVSQTARHFSDEAQEHLIAARVWLTALIIVTVSLACFSLFGDTVLGWAGTQTPAENAGNILHIRYLAQKGLVVFCLVFALIWTARNYGASRHNYVVNKHRNNALGSFQAFAASASDDQTKSAVLIQATQSIFSPQPSGYVKTDGDNSPHSPIIEVVRSMGMQSKEK